MKKVEISVAQAVQNMYRTFSIKPIEKFLKDDVRFSVGVNEVKITGKTEMLNYLSKELKELSTQVEKGETSITTHVVSIIGVHGQLALLKIESSTISYQVMVFPFFTNKKIQSLRFLPTSMEYDEFVYHDEPVN